MPVTGLVVHLRAEPTRERQRREIRLVLTMCNGSLEEMLLETMTVSVGVVVVPLELVAETVNE